MEYYRVILYIGLIILVFIFISMSHSLYIGYQYDNYKQSLIADIERLNKENESMKEQLKYLTTSAYKEKKAKELLNVKNINEQVFVISNNIYKNDNNLSLENDYISENFENLPNYVKWIKYFNN